MRTIAILTATAMSIVVSRWLHLDSGSGLLLTMTTYLAGLALLRPRWLRLKGPVQDDDSSFAGAAITAGLAAVVFGGVLTWRLVVVHEERARCRHAVATAAPGRDRLSALRDTATIPIADVTTCGALIEP